MDLINIKYEIIYITPIPKIKHVLNLLILFLKKYSAVDSSPISKYVTNPFWDKLVNVNRILMIKKALLF